jgi:hypothetical protein
VVAKVRERLTLSKQAARMFYVKRFNLGMLNALETRKEYQMEITNRYAALENLNGRDDIHWENIEPLNAQLNQTAICWHY